MMRHFVIHNCKYNLHILFLLTLSVPNANKNNTLIIILHIICFHYENTQFIN